MSSPFRGVSERQHALAVYLRELGRKRAKTARSVQLAKRRRKNRVLNRMQRASRRANWR